MAIEQGIMVLLVEDNPGDVRLIKEMLQEANSGHMTLRSVDRLSQALEFLQQPCDVVLLDLGLPDNSGLEGLNTLTGKFPSLPVIVLTGLNDEQLGIAAVQAGAQDFLVKEDVTPRLLCRAIGYAVARQQLESQARYAQRMEAVANLTRGVAHDFNNTLTAIVGYASVLEMKLADRPELLRTLQQILGAADRASQLTRALLAFSRDQESSMQRLEIGALLARIAGLLPSLLGRNIDFRTELTDIPLEIHADSSQIEQILVKLTANARQALPEGGTVTLQLQPGELDSRFGSRHGFGEPGPYAHITLADDGQGMAPETAARIFEPFFTTRDTGDGSGLGLAIVFGIVKQHQGYILCTSRPGAGTRFDLYLPLADSPRGRKVLDE